jgi:hypothetical protein
MLIKVYSISIPKPDNIQNPKTFQTQAFQIRDTEVYYYIVCKNLLYRFYLKLVV